jgi:hypothetical protein
VGISTAYVILTLTIGYLRLIIEVFEDVKQVDFENVLDYLEKNQKAHLIWGGLVKST